MERSSSHSAGRTRSITIRNRRPELRNVNVWLESVAKEWKMEQPTSYSLDLVLAEVLVNIIQYGYADDASGRIEVSLEEFPAEFRLTVLDDGKPFNPLDIELPETNRDLDNTWQAGRGILLVRKLCKSMEYSHRDGQNKLTLTVDNDCYA